MKTGLVLEGGAMRGMYTAGVIDILMEENIHADGVIGVSAGAVFGCNYKSRQIGRVIRYNKRFCRDPRYVGLRSLITTGNLYNEEFCYRTVPRELDVFDGKTFAQTPVEFHLVCTDVHTGEAVYHRCDTGNEEDIEWMRASASMPIVSRPVKIGGRELLDGGIADSIPIRWARENGFERNLIVLTRPEGYRKKPSRGAAFLKLLLRKYPKIAEGMAKRHLIYNAALDEIERLRPEGNTLVLCPSRELNISRTENDPEKLEAMYQLGRADALARLEEIRAFFA
ncbi:MAG: patatin family protein [Ruminococcus sp.]|nr:patatin family protein [Ruminococcus sp.]